MVVVGVLHLILYLPENHSLKGKRAVLRSIKQRVRNKFNVSVAECDDLDNWQKITLGVAQIGNDRDHVDRCLREVSTFVSALGLAEPGRESYEFANY
ncbi:MAG TPA: DUF503 domain-containing protein [Candidatus Limnocylindrales bacterium]|nr:DUF503 domain-containing protein [Candidatus Limnocylindrales bacterium]